MNYEKTELYFLKRELMREFGETEGEKLFTRSSKLYAELVVTTDYQGSIALEAQLKRLTYPIIAYYKALRAFGYKMEYSLLLVKKATERAARECAEVLSAQNRKFFAFHAFRRNFKKFCESKFPAAGWSREPAQKEKEKISLRIDRCLYHTITKKFGCPELCGVFCRYEEIAFAGLYPKVVYSGQGFIANGHDYCDFTFSKGEKKDLKN